MRTRFDKRSRRLRKFARWMLLLIGVLILIPITYAVYEDARNEIREVKVINPDASQEPGTSAECDTPDNDITVVIIFNDESETEPFAGCKITLDEWKDVPEWDIPQEYKNTGGCLPESVRTYLYNLCTEKKISYPFMLALIEAESGYQWDAESEDGSCKGYAMINDRWHQKRMESLNVSDIFDPYGNLSVSVDYLSELFNKYHDANTVLMCYNCGESKAAEMMAEGIYSTRYSRKILKREVEISNEIYGN